MANTRFVVVDEDLQQEILRELKAIKELCTNNIGSVKQAKGDVRMDTADLGIYLKLDRRTIYNYRTKKKMPFERIDNGRIYYWKSKIDEYFADNK